MATIEGAYVAYLIAAAAATSVEGSPTTYALDGTSATVVEGPATTYALAAVSALVTVVEGPFTPYSITGRGRGFIGWGVAARFVAVSTPPPPGGNPVSATVTANV